MDALPDWIVPQHLTLALDYLRNLSSLGLIASGLLGAALILLATWLLVLRWRVLLEAQGLHYRPATLWKSWLCACTFGLFFPASTGRDLWRFADVARNTRAPARALAVILLEKVASLTALTLLILVVALPGFALLDLQPAKLRLGIVLLGLLGVSAVGLGLVFQPRILRVVIALFPLPQVLRSALSAFAEAFLVCAQQPRAFRRAVAYSFAAWCCVGLGLGAILGGIAETEQRSAPFVGPVWLAAPALNVAIVRDSIPDAIAATFFPEQRPTLAYAVMGVAAWTLTRFLLAALGVLAFSLRLRYGFRLGGEVKAAGLQTGGLGPEEISDYRRAVPTALLAGFGGGLIGGALTGIIEASWMYWLWLYTATELRMFWWGPLAYGLVFSSIGLGVAVALLFLYLLTGRFRAPAATLATCAGATLAVCFVVIGRFRYARDLLGERALNLQEIAAILLIALVLFVLVERVGTITLRRLRLSRPIAALALLGTWALLIGGGGIVGQLLKQPEYDPPFASPAQATGPNVILIIADTLRADYLPIYSAKAPADTPSLNAFAQDAVVFKNSFSQASWTKPSFGTMFTGRYPSLHGATGKASVLDPDEITLAELLRDAGYYTQGLPNNRNLLPTYGMHRGFVGYDFLIPELYFGATFSVERFALYEVLRRVRIGLQKPYIDIAHFYRPAPGVNAAAAAWLDDNPVPAETPFFLYLHYMDPHDPYMSEDKPGVGYSSMRLGINPDPDIYLQPITYAYIDEIERLDVALGAFFADLKRRGIYDDSLIIFTSDHGEELYEHGGWSHGPTLYDEATHVPIVVKFPGNRHAGTVNESMARHLDLAPTILQQAGLPVPEVMNGIALEDGSGNFMNAKIRESFAETDFTKIIATSVRTLDHKLIRANPGNPRGLEMVELYDLQEDPTESTNRVERGLQYESTLSEALDQYADRVSSDS